MRPRHTRWAAAPAHQRAEALARELQIHPVVAQLLCNRGVTRSEDASRFLKPRLSDLRDPSAMADLDRAALRLARAIDAGERIGVYGDYDVDGVTSTVLLTWVLEELGAVVAYHIPDRLQEGYGLGLEGLRALKRAGASLIVAVDCGATAHEAIGAAQDMGLEVVVADHHQVDASLPQAYAVVNPMRADCDFGDRGLAAVGVVFFLCAALRRALRQAGNERAQRLDLRRGLDLVALGTVADQVPLIGQNRILAHAGLEVANRDPRPGLTALCEVSKVEPRTVDAGRIAYQLAPRLNAAGRMAHARAAYALLRASSLPEARSLARELDGLNQARRALEQDVLAQACAQLESAPELQRMAAIVLGDSSWHPGVIGIVASRLVELFGLPTLLIGAQGRGSGRSVPGIDLHGALCHASHHLQTFGGHAQAVGFRAELEQIGALRQVLDRALLATRLESASAAPRLAIDCALPLAEVNLELVEALAHLSPFGQGNPEPTVAIERVAFKRADPVGRDHVRVVMTQGGSEAHGIAFGMRPELERGCFTDGASVAVVPELDTWGSNRRVSLRIVDIKAP